MRRLRAGDEETILVCPICDSPMIRRRFPGHQQARGLDADAEPWYCRAGKHAFGEPTERPPRAAQSTSGLAKRLDDADPDDVGGALRPDGGVTAADCPNCHTNDDSQTDCPHLLAGDGCPNCGRTLQKPRAGKVECETCEYVVNGQYVDQELRDFAVTVRQGRRLLKLFGETPHGSPGNIANALRKICTERDIRRQELNDVLADLRGVDRYEDDADNLVTDGGLVEACPECESSDINHREFPRTPDEEWFCLDCREAFPEPIQRPPKQPGGNYSAIGKRLIEADPDDLRTDGGAVDSYQLWLGEDCPECGVEIDEGSLRFNGRAWEHKNPETHPQAGHHVIRETIGEEVRTDGGQRTLADAVEPGMVGTCTECEGQLVETLVVLADSGVVVLNCQDCDAEVRVEYQLHEQNPWDVAEDVGGICDPSVASIAWVDCQRCDGHGDIPDPICDLRRSMNGREHPCPECDATGSVPRVVKTDGGVRRRHPGDGAETLAGVSDQDPGCPHGDVECARGGAPCWDCMVGGDET